jgi:hypothetical protein
MIADVPVVGVLPNVETGADRLGITTRGVNVIRGADGLGVRRLGRGLRPPTPSSVEPIGIPTLPTDDTEPIPVGNEVDAAGPAKELPALAAQAPDALPAIPPPSKVARLDAPVIELPMPEDAPVGEAARPKDACGNDPPMPPHALLVEGAMGDVPDTIGLTPGDASSVAPMGILVRATGKPGPTPSGDVIPSGAPGEMFIPPTCA